MKSTEKHNTEVKTIKERPIKKRKLRRQPDLAFWGVKKTHSKEEITEDEA